MATVAELITRVEKRIALASGIGVQTDAEDKFLEMLRHKYETLFDDHWWYDYLTLETFTLNGTTGLVTVDLSQKIRRFSDINAVFYGGDARPLSLLPIGVNPAMFTGRAVSPYAADPKKVFKVWPADLTGDVSVWFRTRLPDDAWDIEAAEETNVNMDSELLILGTVFDFLADDGSNPDAVKKYQGQYTARYQQLVTLGMQHGISKTGGTGGYPTQWSLNG